MTSEGSNLCQILLTKVQLGAHFSTFIPALTHTQTHTHTHTHTHSNFNQLTISQTPIFPPKSPARTNTLSVTGARVSESILSLVTLVI